MMLSERARAAGVSAAMQTNSARTLRGRPSHRLWGLRSGGQTWNSSPARGIRAAAGVSTSGLGGRAPARVVGNDGVPCVRVLDRPGDLLATRAAALSRIERDLSPAHPALGAVGQDVGRRDVHRDE